MIRTASTLLLLRDEPELQVLMVERHRQIDFVGGALVFPGGKVDPHDADPAWANVVAGWGEVPEPERAARIAALRETFEETGVLIGAEGADAGRRANARQELAAGRVSFREIVAELASGFDLSAGLALFSRWVTPGFMPKRFDTFFYLAKAPADAAPLSDGGETVSVDWLGPAEALRLAAAGSRQIVFPTRMNLRVLAESASADHAMSAARTRQVFAIEPQLVKDEGGEFLTLPPEAGFGVVREPFWRPKGG